MARTPKKSPIALAQEHLAGGVAEPPEGIAVVETAPAGEDNAGVHEALHDALLRNLEATADNVLDKHGSLSDRLRDTMIDIIKNRPKPWSQLSSQEQRDVSKAIETAVKHTIRHIIVEVAAEDRPFIRAQLEKTSNDGGKFKGNLTFYTVDEAAVIALFHATGKDVILVVADAGEATTARSQAPIEPDQTGFGFADEQIPAPHPDDNSDLAEAGGAAFAGEAGTNPLPTEPSDLDPPLDPNSKEDREGGED